MTQSRELFLAFRNEREDVSLNEILTFISEADPRVQSNCQLLTTKIKRFIQSSPRPEDVRVNERTLADLFDNNHRIKANFDIMFDYLTQGQGDMLTMEHVRTANTRFSSVLSYSDFSLSQQQIETMMKTISRRPDGAVNRMELYEFIREQ